MSNNIVEAQRDYDTLPTPMPPATKHYWRRRNFRQIENKVKIKVNTLNYRHEFHAGNFADVLKHVFLVRILLYLRRKEKPFRYIDTHAGAGLYDLNGPDAARSGEAREGILRLLQNRLARHGADETCSNPISRRSGRRARRKFIPVRR